MLLLTLNHWRFDQHYPRANKMTLIYCLLIIRRLISNERLCVCVCVCVSVCMSVLTTIHPRTVWRWKTSSGCKKWRCSWSRWVLMSIYTSDSMYSHYGNVQDVIFRRCCSFHVAIDYEEQCEAVIHRCPWLPLQHPDGVLDGCATYIP